MKPTNRARNHVLAILATLTLLPAAALADCWTGCCRSWSEFQRACACEGGISVPNPARCLPKEGPVDGGYTPPLPVDPAIGQRNRYRAVVQGGLVDAAAFGALPLDSDLDFAVALGRLYDVLARTAVVAQADASLYEAQSRDEEAIYADFYAPRFREVGASDGLYASVRADKLQAEEEARALKAEVDRLWGVREAFVNQGPRTAAYRRVAESLASRKAVSVYFGGLTESETLDETWASAAVVPSVQCCADVPMPADLSWSLGPTSRVANLEAKRRAREAVAKAKTAALPPIGGTIDSRLTFVENAAANAAAAVKSLEAWRTHYDGGPRARLLAAQKRWEAVAADNARQQGATHQLKTQEIPKAKLELARVKEVLKSDAWEFYTNGAKAAAWKSFRKEYLLPELERIGIEHFGGRHRFSDDEVAVAWKQGRRAVFGAYITNFNRAVDGRTLIKTAKTLDGVFEAGAIDVANILASADPSDVREVGDALTARLDAASRRQVRETLALTDLPLPFRKFWEGYFAGVPSSGRTE